MEIVVRIDAPELVTAIRELASALDGQRETKTTAHNIIASSNIEEASAQTKSNKTKQNTDTIPTVVELRAKAQEKGKTPEGKQAIKALLEEFGSRSISEIPEEKRNAFMVALEEL